MSVNIKKLKFGELLIYNNPKNSKANGAYVFMGNTFYKINGESYEKIEGEVFQGIDITFVNKTDLLKLLDSKTYSKDNSYMVETSVWIKLYNEINNKNISKLVTGEIEATIASYNEDELNLLLDLTNLYKNLDYDYEKVIYEIKFYNIDKAEIPDDIKIPDTDIISFFLNN